MFHYLECIFATKQDIGERLSEKYTTDKLVKRSAIMDDPGVMHLSKYFLK